MTRILAIETSCDETAAAVVDDGVHARSSVVSSQADLHARFGGVVPELASRAHVELIDDVIAEALVEAGSDLGEIDAVAAVHGPGLAGALLVGVSAAKAIALAADRPYVGVNHHEAHIYAALLEDPTLQPPLVTLIVSGGHTLLVAMRDHGDYEIVGQTVDDAAGEAFDKVARFLGLGYPGGPIIDRLAAQGDPKAVAFPRPMLDDGDGFSFSGLKTAVVQWMRKHPDMEIADVAASFQAAVVDVLVTKLVRVATRLAVPTVVIGGGVAANTALRTRLLDAAETAGLQAVLPSRDLCTDNAAMVGAVAYRRLQADGPTALDGGVYPNLRLGLPPAGAAR
ncbi:MAG TPA: tRNA (adenosine(37)-N6)-threonylcarbamoyltransferase complex transferase subunit TsaD [Acidimicrobiia bacterium]|nr:tRNA (adenosine(37)-N6)-threonylcarbamoyltransferase complex transferase subunit TsaD [Acidimicrobiia bacterium]